MPETFNLSWFFGFMCAMPSSLISEELVFATGDWRPYIFEESGDVVPETPGFSVEIVNKVFEKMGHSITYVSAPFARQIKMAEQGTVDALVGLYQDEAPSLVFPAEPIGTTQNCFFVKSDNSWKYEKIEDLSEIVLGTILGYTYGEIDTFIENKPENIFSLSGSETVMMERLVGLLDMGRVDTFVQDKLITEFFLSNFETNEKLENVGCLAKVPFYVGFSPKGQFSKEFAMEFDKILNEMRRSGELDEILAKYSVLDWER
ncbi:substrate-binding periplasmic protein [Parasedimentitalea maritima]|uniref:Transporter substrate-binding domain-containing protein n=1 Tax=Parasedimentitalea maritima TaxID=2578117 RepID=A0A6A4R9T5_9RHOB|nr:transporter substrate-binding domain-containing protein [Zongyanglinia marina]KAE9625119.1 transporter substrate-binding domain-containing protein [Zongyanglinia marina]